MASVEMLYDFLDNSIKTEFSCEWDNDGKMCVPCPDREVRKVLVCLDVCSEAIDYAIKNDFDCIISHHPLIFDPLKCIDASTHTGRKIYKIMKNDISVFSFHTRLDKVSGGVNDAFADMLCMRNIRDFSDIGRMGCIDECSLIELAKKIKEKTGSDRIICVDSGKKTSKIAIVCGSGKGYIEEAAMCGCDTFLTGELPFNYEHDAKEMGINLICAGHYFTENIVCKRMEMLIKSFDDKIYTEMYETNPSFAL